MRPSALVVGMGAIGQRHARLLRHLELDVAVVSRHGEQAGRRYPSLEAALRREHPAYIVVANETAAHLPTLTALADSGYAGTVLVENIFSWPGIGQYSFRSATTLDLPAIVGVMLFVGLVYILANMAVDILYGILDPRIRYG